MPPTNTLQHESLRHWIIVRPEPAGQFTAQLLGLPELTVTAASRDEAIAQIRGRIIEWIALGHLVPVDIPKEHPLVRYHGWKDLNDPLEQEFLQDLARYRQEDLERTLREYEQEDRECSDTSSTPTT